MKERETKQKEIIINALKGTKSHPTVYELYSMIKKDYPTIGQATVYRNISKLLDNSIIKKITTNDGIDHYDYDLTPHIHLHCAECNNIIDIFSNHLESIINILKEENDVKIHNYSLLISGTCNNCHKIEKEN